MCELGALVWYHITLNRELSEEIIPSRGLPQGDSLSPYLLLICVECFSSMVNHAELRNMIHGIRLCDGAPSIPTLALADDSLIWMETNVNNAASLQNTL